eukprot:TRINITY_DN1385_c0_g1_i2.p1 TRINITY_DN1385_c0_g1~~TRINITY_DN1385_c0_g1_i2.p1  ORF type:complete len:986 (-),score=290.06 TRINITY_DN1385_c0_g1_i2:334-3291(-)
MCIRDRYQRRVHGEMLRETKRTSPSRLLGQLATFSPKLKEITSKMKSLANRNKHVEAPPPPPRAAPPGGHVMTSVTVKALASPAAAKENSNPNEDKIKRLLSPKDPSKRRIGGLGSPMSGPKASFTSLLGRPADDTPMKTVSIDLTQFQGKRELEPSIPSVPDPEAAYSALVHFTCEMFPSVPSSKVMITTYPSAIPMETLAQELVPAAQKECEPVPEMYALPKTLSTNTFSVSSVHETLMETRSVGPRDHEEKPGRRVAEAFERLMASRGPELGRETLFSKLGKTTELPIEPRGSPVAPSRVFEMCERLHKEREFRDEYQRVLSEKYSEFELRECTFAPKINEECMAPRRNVAEFVRDQENFRRAAEDKVAQLREARLCSTASEMLFTPELCARSRKLVEGKEREEVHDRLYRSGRGDSATKVAPLPPFHPKIQEKSRSLIRQEPVQELLYRDALRRNEQQVTNEKLRETSQISTETFLASKATQKAAGQRFAREFDKVWMDLVSGDASADLTTFKRLAAKLGFVSEAALEMTSQTSQRNEERLLVLAAWHMLRGAARNLISRRNALLFFGAVCGLQVLCPKSETSPDSAFTMPRDDERPRRSSGRSDLGRLSDEARRTESVITTVCVDTSDPDLRACEEFAARFPLRFSAAGDIMVAEEDIRVIHRIFEALYLHRLSVGDAAAEPTRDTSQSRRTEVSETTNRLAKAHREKVLAAASELLSAAGIDALPEQVTVEELLNIQRVLKERERRRRAMEIQAERNRECTFKPKTNESRSKANRQMNSEDGEDDEGAGSGRARGRRRGEDLFHLAKNRGERRDRAADEVELERNQKEFTFAPKVKPPRPVVPDSLPRDVEKTVTRLKAAREERLRRHQQFERGCFPVETKEKAFNCAIEKPKKTSNARIPPSGKGKVTQKAPLDRSREGKNRKELSESISDDEEEEEGEAPLLFVDVNLGNGRTERITIREADKTDHLASEFAARYGN